MASCAFLNVARNEPFHYFYKFKIINYKVHIYVMIPMFGIGWILLPLPSSISSRDSECSCRISRHRDILKFLYSLLWIFSRIYTQFHISNIAQLNSFIWSIFTDFTFLTYVPVHSLLIRFRNTSQSWKIEGAFPRTVTAADGLAL